MFLIKKIKDLVPSTYILENLTFDEITGTCF